MRVVSDWMDNLWRACPDALFFCSNGVYSERRRAVMGTGTARAALNIACSSASIAAELRQPPAAFEHVPIRNRTFVEDYVLWKQGSLLAANGNISQILLSEQVSGKIRRLGSLPTKLGTVRVRLEHLCYVLPEYIDRVKVNSDVPGWMLRSDVTLIKKSIDGVVRLADANKWTFVALPYPGGGAGELGDCEIAEIDEHMRGLLDNRFVVFTSPVKKTSKKKSR